MTPSLTAPPKSGAASFAPWAIVPLAALALFPLTYRHFQQLWSISHYQFFPLALLLIAGFAWNRWSAASGTVPARAGLPWRTESTVTSAALALLAAAVWLYNPWSAYVATILAFAVAVLIANRFREARDLWPVWALLWLMVPPPMSLDVLLTQRLQGLSSRLASDWLDVCSIVHMRYGNLFQLESRRLFVDEACSGIVSIMSVIACAALYAVWQRRTLLHTLLLVVTGIGWAAAMNVVRIFVVSAAQAWYNMNLAEGTPHEILGVVVFLGTTLAVISTDQVLAILLAPIRVSAIWQAEAQQNAWISWWNRRIACSDEPAAPPSNPSPNQHRANPFPRPFVVATALACVLLGMYQLAGPSLANQFADREVQNVLKMTADTLPAQIGDWKRVEFETMHREANAELGQYSHAYHYQHIVTGHRVIMSIDFPFRRGWHELCACYRASGWTLLNRGVVEDDASSGSAAWNYVQAMFERKDQTNTGLLLYTFADGQGHRISPPSQDLYERITERIRRRGPYSIAPRYYQIQLWVPHLADNNPDSQETLHQLFKICREHCREFVELSN